MWNIEVIGFIIFAIGVIVYVGPKTLSFEKGPVVKQSTKGEVPCHNNSGKCPSGDCELVGQIYGRC